MQDYNNNYIGYEVDIYNEETKTRQKIKLDDYREAFAFGFYANYFSHDNIGINKSIKYAKLFSSLLKYDSNETPVYGLLWWLVHEGEHLSEDLERSEILDKYYEAHERCGDEFDDEDEYDEDDEDEDY